MSDEYPLKAAFAAFLLETPDKPFEAALKLFPSDRERGKACQITFSWPNDPEVIAEMRRLRESEEYENPELPSKKKLIAMLMAVHDDIKLSPQEKKERISAIKLMADLQGHIVKAESLDINTRRMPTAPVYKIVTE